MSTWTAALGYAGIHDPRLREDYSTQRRLVRRFDSRAYLAVRLLLPPRLHPPIVAAVAFMHETDERVDSGNVEARQSALRSWDQRVSVALEGGGSDDSMLRTLADTVRRHPHMASRVRDFLAAASVEAAWTGSETESDFQRYVTGYSLPALMLMASFLAPPSEADRSDPFHQGCRQLIEAWQRIDHLVDLGQDAEQGKVGIPHSALAEYGLKPDDLRSRPARSDAAVGRLINTQALLAGRALTSSRVLPKLVEQEFRPFLMALISLQELRLGALQRQSGDVLKGGVRPPVVQSVGMLARQFRQARKLQSRRR
ncbi:squalene/phytoene synthase family protein [Streptomyces chartreusis]